MHLCKLYVVCLKLKWNRPPCISGHASAAGFSSVRLSVTLLSLRTQHPLRSLERVGSCCAGTAPFVAFWDTLLSLSVAHAPTQFLSSLKMKEKKGVLPFEDIML